MDTGGLANVQLHHCTWQEVERYLQESRTVVVPIGSTEQHGPNGLIGTDAICPEVIARGLGELRGVLVAPTLAIGMAQHHMRFPGTITLRPTTLIAVVKDIVDSLAQHGFDRVYFLNGHGGNIATVSAALSEIHAEASLRTAPNGRPALDLRLRNWWQGKRVTELSRELFADAEGSHATPSEVSLSFYAHPESVKRAPMSPRIAPSGTFADADDYRRRFPDGRIGSDPSLARIDHGERLYQAALEDVAEDFDVFARANR